MVIGFLVLLIVVLNSDFFDDIGSYFNIMFYVGVGFMIFFFIFVVISEFMFV